METLAEHAALKSCVLGGELSHCSVSVVETGVADAGRDSAEPVTVSCHGVNVNTSGVATLVTAQVKDGVEPTGVLQPEVLGQHGNVSLLTVDSEAIALSGDPQVIHQLHIQHGLEDRAPENGEDPPEVILVYQDIFTCGACSKQFVDLVEFLEHKTHHTIGAVFHKCDLCQMVFRSQVLIADHYQKSHQVTLYGGDQGHDESQQGSGDGEHAETNGISGSIEDLAMGDKDTTVDSVDMETVTKVMMTGGLSVGMVNGEICAKEDTTSLNGQGGGGEQVVFVQNGLSEVPEDLVVADAENANHETMSIEAFTSSEAASTGISLLKPLANGLQSILNDNVSPALESNGQLSDQKTLEDIGNGIVAIEPLPETPSKPDFNFILQTEMVKGSTFTYGKTWFKCLHCDFKTNAKITITKHMQEVHVDLIDLHANMDIKDIMGGDKRKVMKMSTYETIFGRESRFRRRTKKGKRADKQDIPGVYNCSTCGKVFTRMRYLRKHSETHRTEKKYLCDECGKSFKSRTYLSVHRRIHKEKLFHCNQCDFKSKINAAIHAHRQVHSQGSVLCDICGYAYTDKSTLNKHKRVHDLTRPYKCNFPGCTWRFKTEVMCKAHIRAHTTEGKFKCSFCGYLFRHKHHLQRHETSMHGVKHTKTRTNHTTKSTARKPQATLVSDIADTVNLVINTEGDNSMQLQGDGTQHLVVTTDTQGTPIAFEGADLSALNVAYQTLLQNQEAPGDTRTLIMTQPDSDTQIIFKQEY